MRVLTINGSEVICDINDIIFEIEDYYNPKNNLLSKEDMVKTEILFWQNKQGNHIRIKDMNDSYLNNCINLIRRRNGWRKEWLDYLLKVQQNRLTKNRKSKFNKLNSLNF